jgi:hypothetical protein
MTVRVDCACSHVFDADDALAGGVTNCPRCGKATSVPGLRDPFWRVLQAVGVVAIVVAAGFTWQHVGPAAALVVAVGLAAILWGISRAL